MPRFLLFPVLIGAVAAGCGDSPSPPYGTPYEATDPYGESPDAYGESEIRFLDEAEPNITLDTPIVDLTFTSLDGEQVQVGDFLGDGPLVLVLTRGMTDPICPYCSTQTADYIREYSAIREKSAEVLVIYPVQHEQDKSRLDDFLADVRRRLDDPQRPVPFPVLFDVSLAGVNRLGLGKDLAKPATYILDQHGDLQYAYVGSHWGDRQSIEAVLKELDRLNEQAGSRPQDTPPTQPE